MIKKIIKRVLLATIILFMLLAGVVLAFYFSVEYIASDRLYSSIKDIPYRRVGMVLGTNPIGPSGDMNLYFKYRIDACVALYKARKISKILVSGDNHKKEYDEPQSMKDALMERGIPECDIVLDYAGFRTLDSVVRSNKVFGQTGLTIISQGFHNARAVCLALHNGIDAVGFNAKDIKRTKRYYMFGVVRELLARTKMYLDIITGKQPKFLGKAIEI